ncbi:uncharacterized protein N7479_002691 [Penicillium vulpinum]|uniref:Mitochondrial mRNA processing protein PET127 n=1 Tax=Penicillium vulpinum TaxID=29845 RepID=A0A1V6RU37_9EURO|nr:uncharacterized protein N7479_002691 [Penicillium vulpinum]KAJ5972773.1 hypothetical protein N7479_002691 [Penicillium vulpinum]OQE05098.1 hypothetical protein PENVUL_c027G00796 [Penicillium vulpinum]
MFRTSLRPISGRSNRHVWLSLVSPGAPSLRQFHRISALRIDSSEIKLETDSINASTEPPASLSPNGQIPVTEDAASSEPKPTSKLHDLSPRVLTAAMWDEMTASQRKNYRKRHYDEYKKFRQTRLANREIKSVGDQIKPNKAIESELAPIEAAKKEATPPSEAARVEAEQIKALQWKVKTTDVEAEQERRANFQEEKVLASANTKANLAAEILKQKEKESQLEAEVPTDGPADTSAASEFKESTLRLNSTSDVVAQILETSRRTSFVDQYPPPEKVDELALLEEHVLYREYGFLDPKYKELQLEEVPVPMPPVPRLAFGLDRVLFNPGVYQLRDRRSLVYNFDPYLDQIMPVSEFDYSTLKPYITSSKDVTACELTKENEKKYYGSSSSMTGVLSHFHYLLSAWRPVDTSKMTQGFIGTQRNFTRLCRSPTAMFLLYNEKDDIYAIDADKEHDRTSILSHLGKSMEKQLTMPKEQFERYRRSDANKITAEEEASVPESYHYTTMGKFLMRSQLDAYDPRLPGTGMFDLKTRAVITIRMESDTYERGMGYEIRRQYGRWESFEREYFDMIRAAFLKYSLQVRVGRMDGIFVAYHNIERIFGFQYITLGEMDQALHGQPDTDLGDTEFRLSLSLWEKILDKATQKFPKQSLRFHFETRDALKPFMYIVAQPVTDEQIEAIQSTNETEVDAVTNSLLNPDQVDDSESTKPIEAKAKSAAAAPFPAESKFETPEFDTSFDIPGLDPDYKPGANPGANPEAEIEADIEADLEADLEANPNRQSGEYDENVLGMTLEIRNHVNGEIVDRPGNQKLFLKYDRWSIDYQLSELTVEETNKILCGIKDRRDVYNVIENDADDRQNEFFQTLRKFTGKGRAFRKRLDKNDKKRGILVYKDTHTHTV